MRFYYVEIELVNGGKFAGLVICGALGELKERIENNFGKENIASFRHIHVTKNAYSLPNEFVKPRNPDEPYDSDKEWERIQTTFFGR